MVEKINDATIYRVAGILLYTLTIYCLLNILIRHSQ